jgi:hypothetical protein
MIVDTGAWYTVVQPGALHRLGLNPVDRDVLRTAKDEVVPGVVALVDLRVLPHPWLRLHPVFIPDEAIIEDAVIDGGGREQTPDGLLGASTLQEGRLAVDFAQHRVTRGRIARRSRA